jgi:hypothetical protein
MSNEKDKSMTKWTSTNEALLVETLSKEKAKGHWGDNNLKPLAYVACETALVGSKNVSGGGPKTISAIKS